LTFVAFLLQWLLSTMAIASRGGLARRLGHFSIWSDWRPEGTVNAGLDWAPVLLWLALGLAFTALAAWRWRGRDLPA
ncbi:MAG TPA: hypothetical protein VHN99_11140, partial [Deinococcales bacterium]|nr:hypothetical protein [Deinococcales bacterium]